MSRGKIESFGREIWGIEFSDYRRNLEKLRGEKKWKDWENGKITCHEYDSAIIRLMLG